MQNLHHLAAGCQKDTLTFQEKLTILDNMQKMKWSQKQTSSYYNNKGYGAQVSQTNISCWLKDKEKMEAHVGVGGVNPTTHRTHSDHHPELEAALTHWVEQQEAKLLPIKGRLIKVKAERLVKAFTIFVHLFLLFLGHFLYMYIFLNAYTFAVSQPHTFRQLLL